MQKQSPILADFQIILCVPNARKVIQETLQERNAKNKGQNLFWMHHLYLQRMAASYIRIDIALRVLGKLIRFHGKLKLTGFA
jgi:hypothetical protein